MPSRLAYITFIDGGPTDPGYGVPGGGGGNYPTTGPVFPGGPVDPGYGRPGPILRPDNGLPVGPPGSIGTLPVFPFDPSTPVGPGPGGPPTLPSNPIQVHPGLKLVVKYVACHGFIAVPDNTLPGTPAPKG